MLSYFMITISVVIVVVTLINFAQLLEKYSVENNYKHVLFLIISTMIYLLYSTQVIKMTLERI